MSLQKIYQQKLADNIFQPDAGQQQMVNRLDRFSCELHRFYASSLLQRMSKRHPLPGNIYVWGQVGRGKTVLMDMFFQQVQVTKRRLHFGSFMRWLHGELKKQSGETNPLNKIAAGLAKKINLLYFDEFQVIDIGDAMLLGTFLDSLLKQPVSICITTNLAPSELYKDGLQRSRFLPAITLLENEFDIISLDGDKDYRRMHIDLFKHYFFPVNEANRKEFFSGFHRFCTNIKDDTIEINGRIIQVLGSGSDAVCFAFNELCRKPRSIGDYVTISELFPVVFIANIAQLRDSEDDNALRRFINLIDQLYDNKVFLVCLAETSIDKIYTGGLLAQPFERCLSRLVEMQSNQYLEECIEKRKYRL